MSNSYLYYLKQKNKLSSQAESPGVNILDLFSWPNLITLLRAGLIIPMSYSLAWGRVGLFLICASLFALGDLADGYLAFLLNQQTKLGRYFDSTVDKLALLAILLVSIIYNLVGFWLPLTMLLANAIQLLFAWRYLLTDHQRSLPKTYLGPLIGSLFIVSAFIDSTLAPVLHISVVLLSFNHLYYYLKQIYQAQISREKKKILFKLNSLGQFSQNRVLGTIFSYFREKITNRKKRTTVQYQGAGQALNLANLVTVIRLIIVWPIVYCYYQDYFWLALGLATLFILLDFCDGHLARKQNQQTAIGQILDALTDKLALLIFLLVCASEGFLPAWLLCLILIRVALIFVTAAMIYLFTKAPLPIAYYSLVSVLAILAYLIWPGEVLAWLAASFTIQLIINYLYQGLVIIKRHKLSLSGAGNIFSTEK